ncbi:MAG TPA: glycosyltransferase family 4 protein [Flavisolibacter sp.]|nr:glycosyltransferase family 4 protein [Flavisolibacter sp.]
MKQYFKNLKENTPPWLYNVMRRLYRMGVIRTGANAATTYKETFKPYVVRIAQPLKVNREKVLHVIGNFWTGGSARLVVDLIEHLGHCYEQEVITRDLPPEPAYTNMTIVLCEETDSIDSILVQLNRLQPALVHVHYLGHERDEWGAMDRKWYGNIFNAIEQYGCPVIENINIPTKPYLSNQVTKYVYVSKYVMEEYGTPNHRHTVIYPGSDFTRFSRVDHQDIPDGCIGMVYRLERDKINEHAIDVFIDVIRRRKGTKALIVGGGNLMIHFQNAVAKAGLTRSFIFTGYVAYERLPEYYKMLSIFVAPVHRESFGQVTPFAMHMGIPVTGYAVGALPEIVNNNDMLAPPGNYKKLSDIICRLLDNREQRLRIGAANYLRAKQLFSVQAMIKAYERVYDDALTGIPQG